MAALSRLTGAELSIVTVPYYNVAAFDGILRSDNRRTFDGLLGGSDTVATAQFENLTQMTRIIQSYNGGLTYRTSREPSPWQFMYAFAAHV